MTQLRGQAAVITGAGGGIGRAIALAFAGEGASIAALDIDEGGARETAEMASRNSRGYGCDLSKRAAVIAAVDDFAAMRAASTSSSTTRCSSTTRRSSK